MNALADDASECSVRADIDVADVDEVASDVVEEPVELAWTLSSVFDLRKRVLGVGELSSRRGTE